ncbi:beta-ketoacyl-ACP synthase II [Thermomicrobium sp. CFH 73360]|uniref:beta-ketoacyl-ACP synthase II n=1 Tax=Thermomicrobium sp. CFH 73360 TaxID=2951987 RepID=UPI0020778EE8|nr:beta-ketoacyl-ACP synthase II [Thermomicrobium sp. CFH 73360]MCM8747396.1 beta-ketoacyl-ACP synthase II [Thermomicrobium sp. CFH 73360]
MRCHHCGDQVPEGARFCPWCGARMSNGTGPVRRRVVITGLGAVTPLGLSAEETWHRVLRGESGVRRIERFDPSELPVQIAAEVRGFTLGDWVDPKTARQMAMFSQYALEAGGQALRDAGLKSDDLDPARAAVVIGTGAGGMATILETQELAQRRGLMRISPHFMTTFPHNMPAYHLAQAFRFVGPSLTISTACATGAQAIGEAAEMIRSGAADVALAGGTEYCVFPLFIASFAVQRAASTWNDRPEAASRPFDAQRHGFVVGEGAGIVVLEALDHARARGARIYAELLGYASSNDGFHPIAPDPEGSGAARAMRAALDDAGVMPEAVDYINAHAASTPLGDRAETVAIKAVFGERAYRIPISSTKSMIGHLMGAAGAVESIMTILSIRDGMVHPTRNYEFPDPECDLDYVPEGARRHRVRVALKNSFGLGGQNCCLVFAAWEDEQRAERQGG